MNSVRNLFRVLCILAVTMSLINCQTDTVAEIQQEKTLQKAFPFKSSVLTKQDVEANTKLSNQMRSLATLQSSNLSESVYNSLYNFSVATDVVKFVESTENNSHSYTFPIERENSTGTELENLVFAYDEATEDYTASLVTYHFNASQKQEFFLTQHVTTPHDISYQPIAMNLSDVLAENSLTTPCTTTYTVYHVTPDTEDTFVYSTNGNVNNVCEHEYDDDPCETYTVIEVDCPDGGSSSANDSGTPSSGSSSTSSTGGGNNSGNDTTTPNTDDDEPNIITSPILKEEVAGMIERLNETLGEGNWEFGNNTEDEPSFDSYEEFEAFAESLTGTVEATQSSSAGIQNGQVISNFSFPTTEYFNIVDLEVEIVSKPENFETGQQFEVLGINSYLSGLSVIMSWEPNENYGVYTSSTNTNMKRIIMTGVIRRGVMIEGIDISYKQPCTVMMEVNRYDGTPGDSYMNCN